MLYSLKNMTMKQGKTTILDIPELDLYRGRIYVLQGSNGAGKTSLLNTLAFLTAPTSGDIIFQGGRALFDQRTLLRLRREVTLLHQAPYLFDGSVHDNVVFGLKVRGVTGDEQRRLVAEALTMVGLAGFENRKARALSGGEAQRVALARALVLKPVVLLLDEPLSNVDGESAQLIEKVIASLPDTGTTVIVASHDHLLPKRLEAEVIRLVSGRVIERKGQNPIISGDKCYANL